MEATSYSTMEYSLSDIQLPDPPKEKVTANENLKKSSKEIKSASKLEKNHASKNEGKIALSSNSTKDESNGILKKVCDPPSPKACVISEDSERDDLDTSQSEKNDVKEELKNSPKEGNNQKITEIPPIVEESTDVKEITDKISVVKDTSISEENCDSVNDTTTKQSEAEIDNKNSNSSLSNASSTTQKEQHKSKKCDDAHKPKKCDDAHKPKKCDDAHKPKKCDDAVPAPKEKHSQNVNKITEPAVDNETATIARKRKNRRTSRNSSRSSSSSSSSANGSSPERESLHSKKSGKLGSSSEGIASPSSSGSCSGSESEQDKKCFPNEKPKVDKKGSVPSSEEVVKQRRKINRNLPVKGFQENKAAKDTEVENTKEPSSTASHKVKKDETNKNDETIKKAEVREMKFTPRKLSLTSLKSTEKSEDQDSEKSNSKLGVKKRKWGNYCTAALSRTSVSISSDSLKTLIPDLKPFTVAPVLSDQEDLSNPVGMESPPKKEQKIVNLPAPEEMVLEEIPAHLQIDKASTVGDTKDLPNKSVSVSPPHNPVSNILFIKNLVRPFTLLQLKELLKQTGKVDEESFWIDKIKSKCIVVYETEEQAVTTRAALHGTRWPLSNPKILSVDFSTKEELDAHQNMTEHPKPVKILQHVPFEKQEMKEAQAVDIPKRKREEHKRDKDHQKLPITHVREWDKDKLTQDSPDQASHRVEKDAEKARSDKRKEKKDSKRRVDDDAPAKLLDDLFRKTRASPCIYWLPLTEEQAKQREEERQARRIEREKRWQQRKEQEENERRNRTKGYSGREKENRRSQSRSRSPLGRRR